MGGYYYNQKETIHLYSYVTSSGCRVTFTLADRKTDFTLEAVPLDSRHTLYLGCSVVDEHYAITYFGLKSREVKHFGNARTITCVVGSSVGESMVEFVLSPAPLTAGEIAGIVIGTLVAFAFFGLTFAGMIYWHIWIYKRDNHRVKNTSLPSEEPSSIHPSIENPGETPSVIV